MNVLNIEHVSKIFGEKKIFDDVSYGIHEGDKIGIIGINGTGKTTLLKMVAGLEETDEGQIIKQNGLRIPYLPQNPEFQPNATVLTYVTQEKEYEARNILNKLGITDHDASITHLSGGQKKRVALARALVNPSDVLILDEPTAGLDVVARDEILDMLRDYMESGENSILISSHISSDLENLCDDFYMIHDGKKSAKSFLSSEYRYEYIDTYGIEKHL